MQFFTLALFASLLVLAQAAPQASAPAPAPQECPPLVKTVANCIRVEIFGLKPRNEDDEPSGRDKILKCVEKEFTAVDCDVPAAEVVDEVVKRIYEGKPKKCRKGQPGCSS